MLLRSGYTSNDSLYCKLTQSHLHIKTKHIKTSSPLYSKENRKNDIKVIYVPTQEQDKQFYETFKKSPYCNF
jgi:Trk K+ transport system NAD-binding subunit